MVPVAALKMLTIASSPDETRCIRDNRSRGCPGFRKLYPGYSLNSAGRVTTLATECYYLRSFYDLRGED